MNGMADNSEIAIQLVVVSKYPWRTLIFSTGARLERNSESPIKRQKRAELRNGDPGSGSVVNVITGGNQHGSAKMLIK